MWYKQSTRWIFKIGKYCPSQLQGRMEFCATAFLFTEQSGKNGSKSRSYLFAQINLGIACTITRQCKNDGTRVAQPIAIRPHDSNGEPHECKQHTQQPSWSSPDLHAQKATDVILPRDHKLTEDSNKGDSIHNFDKHSPVKEDVTIMTHNLYYGIKAWGVRRWPWNWPRVNFTFKGYPRWQGWVVRIMRMLECIKTTWIFRSDRRTQENW
jgi:hypothetical protein